jgi:hypothetical protein
LIPRQPLEDEIDNTISRLCSEDNTAVYHKTIQSLRRPQVYQSLLSHVQGVVSQLFDFPEKLSESFIGSLKITLKYQWVAGTP